MYRAKEGCDLRTDNLCGMCSVIDDIRIGFFFVPFSDNVEQDCYDFPFSRYNYIN